METELATVREESQAESAAHEAEVKSMEQHLSLEQAEYRSKLQAAENRIKDLQQQLQHQQRQSQVSRYDSLIPLWCLVEAALLLGILIPYIASRGTSVCHTLISVPKVTRFKILPRHTSCACSQFLPNQTSCFI